MALSKTETTPDEIDVTDYAGDTIRLMTHIVGVMNSPEIVEGDVSSTGKTIRAPHPHKDGTHVRLDTATILAGDGEYRDSRAFSLYTYDTFQRTQKANLAPGPQAGANRVSDHEDLPEPTHEVVGDDTEQADRDNDEDDDGDGGEDGEVKADAARSTDQETDMALSERVVLPDGGKHVIPADDLDADTPGLERGATVTLYYDSTQSDSDGPTMFTGDVTYVGDREFAVEQGDSTEDGTLRKVEFLFQKVKTCSSAQERRIGDLEKVEIEPAPDTSDEADSDPTTEPSESGADSTEKTPDELSEGDRLEVEYDPVNGEQTQSLSGTVDDVDRLTDGETVHIVKAAVVPDEGVRVERDDYFARDGEASRRVEFVRKSDDNWSGYAVEGKNGARWNRISRVSGVESWTLTDGDDAEAQPEGETDA